MSKRTRVTLATLAVGGLALAGPAAAGLQPTPAGYRASSGSVLTRQGAPSVAQPRDADALLLSPISSGPAYDHAPRLWLHSDEHLWPFGPLDFITHSSLVWVHDRGCDDWTASENPSYGDLGSGTYYHQAVDGGAPCTAHYGTAFVTNSYSAVNEDYEANRPEPGEGWMLQLDNAYRDGEGFDNTETIVVRQDHAENWIQYWYNFGNSTNRWGTGHEGDWEHISIRLNASDVPVEVEYSFHHEKCTLPWSDAPRVDGRPVVWIAKESHGSYPSQMNRTYYPGNQTTQRDLIDGPASGAHFWNAQANLKSLSDFAWYDYGGSWGDRHGDLDDQRTEEERDFGPSSPGWWRASPSFTAINCNLYDPASD